MNFRKYCAYDYGQLSVVIASIILILVKPNVFVKMTRHILGRILLITLLVMASLHSTLSGVLIAIVFVVLTETFYEGLTEKTDVVNEEDEEVDVEGDEEETDGLKNPFGDMENFLQNEKEGLGVDMIDKVLSA